MKDKKIRDKRVINVKRKIQSDLCQILILALLVSTIVQQYFQMPVQNYIVEAVCFVGGSFYILFRNLFSGNLIYSENSPKKIMILNIVISSISATIVNAVFNYTKYSEQYFGVFDMKFLSGVFFFLISVVIFSSAMFGSIYFLNNKKQKEIERKLDEEENETE